MKKGIRLTADRDMSMLTFIWRWKVATSATLMRKFFPDAKPKTAYRRINDFEHAQLIEARNESIGRGVLWTLTKRGFFEIKETLPALKEEVFGPEKLQHDHLASAFHIGDWLTDVPEGVTRFSEQQLRSYDELSFPSWVPRDLRHRCDGYTFVPGTNKPRIIAHEVEISPKKSAVYGRVGRYYEDNWKIDLVIWLVPDATFGRRIEAIIQEALQTKEIKHRFFTVPHFAKEGWQARHIGSNGTPFSIHEILEIRKDTMETPGRHGSVPLLLLNKLKSPFNTTHSGGLKNV